MLFNNFVSEIYLWKKLNIKDVLEVQNSKVRHLYSNSISIEEPWQEMRMPKYTMQATMR